MHRGHRPGHRTPHPQSLYALCMVLCIVSTFLSIAFIFLVKLYYAVAPRIFRYGGRGTGG